MSESGFWGGTTILDVVDNFTTSKRQDISTLPGAALLEFGQEAQRFSSLYEPAAIQSNSYPVYLGGWPSANFWASLHSPLILSTLLYSGQILAKDPILDWFSLDRYRIAGAMGGRQGYLSESGDPNIVGTRAFLRVVLPALQQLRPLIASGALVLVPGESFAATHELEVDELASTIGSSAAFAPERIAEQFGPAQMAWDDRLRGMFVCAPGDADAAIRRAVDHSLRYFAREYLLAASHGVEYAAPWTYEQYMCEEGLESSLLRSESQRILKALWYTDLPIFSGLNPKLLVSVREDDAFMEFRSQLAGAYRGLPENATDDEYARYLAEVEHTWLRPHIQKAEREADGGALARIGVELTQFTAYMSAAIAIDATRGQIGWQSGVTGGLGYLVGKVVSPKRTRDATTIWTNLSRHRMSVDTQMDRVQLVDRDNARPWNIPAEPSMSVVVTPGAVIIDGSPPPQAEPAGYSEGTYAPCTCGSGLKWRFCCRGVPGSQPPTPPSEDS